MGALDFAGGTVVHISSGVCALAAALFIGKRLGYPREPMPPHNLSLTLAGAGLLWVGWFGFNAGQRAGANGLAVSAFVATHLGASAAALTWMAAEWCKAGGPPCSARRAEPSPDSWRLRLRQVCQPDFRRSSSAASRECSAFTAVRLKPRFNYDDALDVVGVHGVGGILGALATGLFASAMVNPAGANGLFYGNPHQFFIQAIGVVATIAFSFVGSSILLKLTDAVVGIRVTRDDEQTGLDLSQHNESAYAVEA